MKMNRVIALMTAMLLTFSLTACAESSAAPELDGKTEYELLEVENEILLANNALWEKVFLSMSKNVTDDVLSSNYGDVLMSAVEGAKEQFSEEEYEKLKADAEQIRTIEEKIAEISARMRRRATPSRSSAARIWTETTWITVCFLPMPSRL